MFLFVITIGKVHLFREKPLPALPGDHSGTVWYLHQLRLEDK